MLINYLIIIITIMFLFMNHPLTLGLMLLIQTILIAFLSSLMNLNSWFSYILFLIMIGGMLILFIYMTSIASNEKFLLSSNLMITFMISMIFLVIAMFMYESILFNLKISLFESMNMHIHNNYKLTMNKLFQPPMMNLFTIMISYLFITLIMVVKITNLNYGPLRQKF
uniref:NADH-ubiquinone oxidoreductase chain 6 n=1 Tax=Cerambycidae sp. 7 KM-2017 TaxID=2219292 RepID=A0A346RI21_9CUCU|nr:NADH dehydrogenase subunit 6 [Cerambycidae sp. 7 KM-2017]